MQSSQDPNDNNGARPLDISFGQKIETTERPVVHGTMDSKADFPAATA
jgi:hypothetical protein